MQKSGVKGFIYGVAYILLLNSAWVFIPISSLSSIAPSIAYWAMIFVLALFAWRRSHWVGLLLWFLSILGFSLIPAAQSALGFPADFAGWPGFMVMLKIGVVLTSLMFGLGWLASMFFRNRRQAD